MAATDDRKDCFALEMVAADEFVVCRLLDVGDSAVCPGSV